MISHVLAGLAEKSKTYSAPWVDKTRAAILAALTPKQLAYVQDSAQYKSARCPRRSGKTFAVVAQLLDGCLGKAGSAYIYLTLTKGQGRHNIWQTLKRYNDDYELGADFHGTDLRMTLPNGSTITISGAETMAEIDKLRGQSFDGVVIDEAKSFTDEVLISLLWEVVRPALSDRRGWLAMIGTPGNVLSGPFYEATSVGNKLWSFHKWNLQDNTAMPHLWPDALRFKEQMGWADDHPTWLREFLGEWAVTLDLLVYKFDAMRNIYATLPSDITDWVYLMGVDFGFQDDFAISVAAYSPHHDKFYEVYDFGAPHMTVPQMANEIKYVIDTFGTFDAMVCDAGGGLGQTLMNTLNQQYGFNFEAAEKTEKLDYIELVNSDLTCGNIKIRAESGLVREMEHLQWEDAHKRREDKGTPNHRCDAFLYLYRYAYHFFASPKKREPIFGSKEYWAAWNKRSFDAAVKRKQTPDQLGYKANMDPDLSLWDPRSLTN